MSEYSSIPTALSDESDDEVYVRDPANYGDLELKLLPVSSGRNRNNNLKAGTPRSLYKKQGALSCCKILCLLLFVLMSVLVACIVIGAIIISVRNSSIHSKDGKTYNQSAYWNVSYSGTGMFHPTNQSSHSMYCVFSFYHCFFKFAIFAVKLYRN